MRKKQIQVRVIQAIILVKMNSVKSRQKNLSMLNTSISVGKINEKEHKCVLYRNNFGTMNSVDIV